MVRQALLPPCRCERTQATKERGRLLCHQRCCYLKSGETLESDAQNYWVTADPQALVLIEGHGKEAFTIRDTQEADRDYVFAFTTDPRDMPFNELHA